MSLVARAPRWRATFAVAALAALAACGSTVPQEVATGRGEPGISVGEPAPAEQVGEGVDVTQVPGAPGTTTPGARTPAGGTTPTTVGSAGGGGGGGGGGAGGGDRPAGWIPAGPGARGVSDTTIKVGIMTGSSASSSAVLGSLGASRPDFSFDKANAAALEVVNSRGGIAGRKVEPVVYTYNSQSVLTGSGRQQEAQRACATWTEDNEVFAMSGRSMTTDNILDCAAKSGTVLVSAGYSIPMSESRFQSMSQLWYGPSELLTERAERAKVKFLLKHGWLKKGAKVGLMVEDRPTIREGVNDGLKPTLAAAGFDVEVEVVYPDPVESNWQNYVLQFQTSGVTHVIWSTTSTPDLAVLFMTRAAENQSYRPQWAVDSTHAVGKCAGLCPDAQMATTYAFGWKPNFDINDPADQSENSRLCAEALRKHGQDPALDWGRDQCEFLLFLKAALEKAPEVSPAGLAAGTAALNASFGTVRTYDGASSFGPNRHDGVILLRGSTWDSGKELFQYATPTEPITNFE